MSFETAEQAGSLIAEFVEKSWPMDRESVYRILDLVNEQIWRSGYFQDSTKWYYAKVREDNTIITPHGYNILVGANTKFDKAVIRDTPFMFHSNGSRIEPPQSETFSRNIQFLGDYPTMISHMQDSLKHFKGEYKVGVHAPGMPAMRYPPISIVSCLNLNGKPVYTYRFNEKDDLDVLDENYTPDNVNLEDGIIEGVQYAIGDKMVVYDNVIVSQIYNIIKEQTLAEVNYYLIPKDCCDSAILVASLQPFQTKSRYKVYKVNSKCVVDGCCFGLFKRSKPDDIVNDSQLMMTDDKNAIINLAKGVYHWFYKENQQKAVPFITAGLDSLARSVNQSNPEISMPIQVDDKTLRASRRFNKTRC